MASNRYEILPPDSPASGTGNNRYEIVSDTAQLPPPVEGADPDGGIGNALIGVGKVVAPIAADVALTALVPESVLLRALTKFPKILPVAKEVFKRGGPEAVRRLFGTLAGATTALATQGPGSAVGYLAAGTMPMAAALKTGSPLVGGAAGGAAASTVGALADRGELPSLPEVGMGVAFGGMSEKIAAATPQLFNTQLDPRIAKIKSAYPELADIPDALFAEKDSWAKRLLDSFSSDPFANAPITRAVDDLNLASGKALTRTLGVRPPAEAMRSSTAPNLDALRSSLDDVIGGFEVPRPAIPDPGMSRAGIVEGMTAPLQTPYPGHPSIVGEAVPTTPQRVGQEAREVLSRRDTRIRSEGTKAYGDMLRRIEAEPEVALPLGPLQEGVDAARARAGRPIIPEGGQRALRTVGNVEEAINIKPGSEDVEELYREFPDLFGHLEGLSRITSRTAPRLLQDLSAAKARYGGDVAKAMIGDVERSVWSALEASGLRPEAIADLRAGRADYAKMKAESKMLRKTLKGTQEAPERLGTRIEKFNPDRVSADAPNTILGSLTREGFDVRRQARNLVINDLASKLRSGAPGGEDIPTLLRTAAKNPLLLGDRSKMVGHAEEMERFLNNPKMRDKARQYFDVLTGEGPGSVGPGGSMEAKEALLAEAMQFADTLPEGIQTAIGRNAARNILARATKTQTPVPGARGLQVFDEKVLDELLQNSGGLALLPKEERQAILEFAVGSKEAFNDVSKVANTISVMYNPKDYSGMANMFQGYFREADPRSIRKVRDLLKGVPGGNKTWEDFATSQISTNIFDGTDFSGDKLVRLFENADGGMVPRETLDVMTEHLSPDNRKALFDFYDVVKATADVDPRKPNPLPSAGRTGFSMGKTATEATGWRAVVTRLLPYLVSPAGRGIGAAGAGALAAKAFGIAAGAATTLGAGAAAMATPYIITKALLTKGDSLKKWLDPAIKFAATQGIRATTRVADFLQDDEPTGGSR